jgi:uncharacterized membrane protein
MQPNSGNQITYIRKGELKMTDTTEKTNQTQQPEQGVPAVGFLVIAFTAETAGDDALEAMKEAKKQQKFYFENAAVIRQDANGKVHYKETGDMHMGKGAGVGALIGGVLGILGGPAGIAIGASAGAALGAAASHGDAGFRDESLQKVGLALRPGTSAVVAITDEIFLRSLQEQVSIEDIRTIVSNLAGEISYRLNEGKSVALGIILAETGLAFKELAVDENSAEVVGLAITNDAVIAGVAVATADQLDYKLAAATEEGAVGEVGTATKEGALIVDDVVTDEGEAVVATVLVPDDAAAGTPAKEDAPADAGKPEDKPAAA